MPRPSRRAVSGPGLGSGAAGSSGNGLGRNGSSSGSSGSVGYGGGGGDGDGDRGNGTQTTTSSSSSSSSSRPSRHSLSSSTSSIGTSSPGAERSTPPRALDRSISQIEILYNTAVQEFVRRNHAKAQTSLGRLLDLLAREREKEEPEVGQGAMGESLDVSWYDFSSASGMHTSGNEEWTVKTLKLSISSLASLYADAPSSARLVSLDPALQELLPPAPADRVLSHLHNLCIKHTSSSLLPPALISTLLLASLKIPSPSAVAWAHSLAEDWIGALPDAFFVALNPRAPHQITAADLKRKVESAREGYLKVVELFTGEVLVREGEWEMARAFLDSEGVMGSKRKEALYKHIRSAERSRAIASAPSTPSSSVILPSISGPNSGIASTIASGNASRVRSRAGSNASSESEATARPLGASVGSAGGSTSPISRMTRPFDSSTSDGAKKASKGALQIPSFKRHVDAGVRDDDASTTASTRSTLPSRIFVNPLASRFGTSGESSREPISRSSVGSGPSSSGGGKEGWESILALLPRSIRARLAPMLRHPWLIGAIAGLPTVLLFLTVGLVLRRRWKKRGQVGRLSRVQTQGGQVASPAGIGGAVAPGVRSAVGEGAGVGVGGAVSGMSDASMILRERLRGERGRGVLQWWAIWWRWWVGKMLGVWEMGTTITYV